MEKQHIVYILNVDGKPLMPTKRFGKVRRMLKSGQARVVKSVPFTVQLLYRTETEVVQPIIVGQDPGRTNIGMAAVRSDGECLYMSHTTTRNKEIPRLMRERKMHRQASRRGERLRRKRRATKCGTLMSAHITRMEDGRPVKERMLPGYEKPVPVKDIINTESKFLNRKRPDGWLTPTARQLLNTHLREFELISEILPVSDVCVEVNRFAFMALENPNVHGIDFQNGALKGFSGKHEAVSAMQNGKCLFCRRAGIEHYHHIVPRSRGGADTVDNLAGLCLSCHDKIHKDPVAMARLKTLHAGRNKKYGALSVLNQIIPFLVDGLENRYPGHTYVTTGYNTKEMRLSLNLDKEHELDAYCIALSVLKNSGVAISSTDSMPVTHEIVQFRRRNRAKIHSQRERTYKLGKVTIAKNRKPRTSQSDDAVAADGTVKAPKTLSLSEWYEKQTEFLGEAEARKLLSKVTVIKSERRYNPDSKTRLFAPGDTVEYDGTRYVIRGQQNNGDLLKFIGQRDARFKVVECRLVKKNGGLVYVS